MRVAIVDCGAGNLHSVAAGFRRASVGLEVAFTVSDRPGPLVDADAIVLPGVGAFADCMRGLDARPGLREALERRAREAGVPFLGICVGMQMMFDKSHEHGEHAGLGWIPGEVAALVPVEGLRVPHMGWNELALRRPGHPFFAGVKDGDHVYFVHSYHVRCAEAADALATVDYGGEICAAVGRDHLLGVQFHPEKSQRAGERLLRNFLTMSAKGL